MEKKELEALVSLLDDEDTDIVSHVEEKIISLGESIIPFLERAWEKSMDPAVQERIEDLVHQLQYDLFPVTVCGHEWTGKSSSDLHPEFRQPFYIRIRHESIRTGGYTQDQGSIAAYRMIIHLNEFIQGVNDMFPLWFPEPVMSSIPPQRGIALVKIKTCLMADGKNGNLKARFLQ